MFEILTTIISVLVRARLTSNNYEWLGMTTKNGFAGNHDQNHQYVNRALLVNRNAIADSVDNLSFVNLPLI